MISYYWSNVDNGFQTNASSFLAAALNSSDLETKGATCLSRESSWQAKRWANACSLHDSPCITHLPLKICCGSSEYCHRQFLPLPEWNCTPINSSTPFSLFRLRFDLREAGCPIGLSLLSAADLKTSRATNHNSSTPFSCFDCGSILERLVVQSD